MSDNAWKAGAAKRRDEKQVKDPAQEVVRKSPRKDKARWCRGKTGTNHTPVCKTFAEAKSKPSDGYWSNWRILVCSTCGKELKHFFPLWGLVKEKEPPAWVDK